jgi:hypothetical protein
MLRHPSSPFDRLRMTKGELRMTKGEIRVTKGRMTRENMENGKCTLK